MKKLKQLPVYCSISVVLGVLSILVLFQLDFVSLQGFNPSDDGVILAQSFRILNGEIPHVDFITIRPAFSGYLHTIDFLLPGALVPNSRWMVVVQHLIIASTFSYIWMDNMKAWSPRFKQLIFIASTLLLFWMNGIRIIPFPWTTVDATMFSVLGTLCYYKFLNHTVRSRKNAALALLFFSLAALSRQTFLILFIVGSIFILPGFIKARNYKALIYVVLIACAPFILYGGLLLIHGAFNDFISQISSQSAFYETAVQHYLNVITESRFVDLNTILVIVALSAYFFVKSAQIRNILRALVSLYFLALALYLGHQLSISTPLVASELSFELFWMLMGILVFETVITQKSKKVLLGFLTLLIAWVSSISIGMNTPLFAAGLMLFSVVYLALDGIAIIRSIKYMKYIEVVGFMVVCTFLIHRNYVSQQYFNYRDLGQRQLTDELDSFQNFGSIKTNTNTAEYYTELAEILAAYPAIKNNFICVPNNAIIYPLSGSQNPMCVDWMQPAEYPGFEEEINSELINLIEEQNTYIIWDKLNSKQMAFGRSDEIHSAYSYAAEIKENCSIIEETYYFYVFRKQ